MASSDPSSLDNKPRLTGARTRQLRSTKVSAAMPTRHRTERNEVVIPAIPGLASKSLGNVHNRQRIQRQGISKTQNRLFSDTVNRLEELRVGHNSKLNGLRIEQKRDLDRIIKARNEIGYRIIAILDSLRDANIAMSAELRVAMEGRSKDMTKRSHSGSQARGTVDRRTRKVEKP